MILTAKRSVLILLLSTPCIHGFSEDLKSLQKSWTGTFDDRKISVFIQSINTQKVQGYSLLGANKQNFSGTVKATKNPREYKITAVESGAAASRGTFVFIAQLNQPNKLEASWESATAKVKPKYFELKAQQCRYDLNAGEYAVASKRLLKDEDLQIPVEELDNMRNEIYARHGYSFANKQVLKYFQSEPWYMPCSTHVEAQLTSIEKTNIQRIKKVRPYMEKMDWGR